MRRGTKVKRGERHGVVTEIDKNVLGLPVFKVRWSDGSWGWLGRSEISRADDDDKPMPWCERCKCYHHATAECVALSAPAGKGN